MLLFSVRIQETEKSYRISKKSYKTKLQLIHSGPDYFGGITVNGEEPFSYITEKKN